MVRRHQVQEYYYCYYYYYYYGYVGGATEWWEQPHHQPGSRVGCWRIYLPGERAKCGKIFLRREFAQTWAIICRRHNKIVWWNSWDVWWSNGSFNSTPKVRISAWVLPIGRPSVKKLKVKKWDQSNAVFQIN